MKKKSKKSTTKKNKLGVKNSLVNNINARKKKGISRSKKKSEIGKKAYKKMKTNWGGSKRSLYKGKNVISNEERGEIFIKTASE